MGQGAVCARHSCLPGPAWPWIPAECIGGASGARADESIELDGYSITLSIADSHVFCTVHGVSDMLRSWRVGIGHYDPQGRSWQLEFERRPRARSRRSETTDTYINPFPPLVISEMTSAFHADARLRARRRP